MQSFSKLALYKETFGPELQKREFADFRRVESVTAAVTKGISNAIFVDGRYADMRGQKTLCSGAHGNQIRSWNHIMWPKPKTSGCTCIYTNEHRQADLKQKYLFDDQQKIKHSHVQEAFLPVKNKSTDTTHSEDTFNQDFASYKRLKVNNYSIQKTGSMCFIREEKHEALGNSAFKIITQGGYSDKQEQGYQLQSYHILSFEREAPAENLTIFRSVYGILRNIFKNSIYVDEIKKLSPDSFLVFSLIVYKKFKINISSSDDTEALAQLAEMVSSRNVHKRPEECKKIVFSYTIKQLKHRLRDQYTLQYRKTNFDEFFYQYYFEHISHAEGIQLEDFYYPIASTKCKKNSAKTINTAYLSNIRKSDKFMGDLRTYIYSPLLKDYAKEIDCKLLDLVTRWELEAKKSSTLENLRTSLGSYFKGSKSKLPWTIFEVQHAIEKVRSVVY